MATYTVTLEKLTVNGYHKLRNQSLNVKSRICLNEPWIGLGSLELFAGFLGYFNLGPPNLNIKIKLIMISMRYFIVNAPVNPQNGNLYPRISTLDMMQKTRVASMVEKMLYF